MKTVISGENPFGFTRYGFAFEHIGAGARCLDFGCHDGWFLGEFGEKKQVQAVGVDKNPEAVAKNPHGLDLRVFGSLPLEFESSSFDAVTILDVLEHIHDQGAVLAELHRVLKPGGVLIITVPGQHFLSWLDVGNFKFRFPGLHRMFFRMRHSEEEYRYRFVENPHGLVGDIEIEKSWHQHFSSRELEDLLKPLGFEIRQFDGTCRFGRLFHLLSAVGLGRLIPEKVWEADRKNHEDMNLFCLAEKV